MQTRCPQCRNVLNIDADQLQDGQRQIKCAYCEASFDALAALTDEPETSDDSTPPDLVPPAFTALINPDAEPAEPMPQQRRLLGPLPWEEGFETPSPRHALWAFGVVLLILLLSWQVYRFEGGRIAQSARIRPWLIALCKPLHCTLPAYKNVSGIDVIERTLSPLSGGGLEFRALFVNNTAFPQAMPSLKLTLLSFNGNAYAQRIFTPNEYLAEKPAAAELPVGRPVEARMHIAGPTVDVAGYTFEFI